MIDLSSVPDDVIFAEAARRARQAQQRTAKNVTRPDALDSHCTAVLKWIERRGVERFKARDVQAALDTAARFRTVEEVNATLRRLVEACRLRVVASDYRGVGRPSSAVYEPTTPETKLTHLTKVRQA